MSYAMTPEIRDLRQRFREFIDDEVIPAEPALYQESPVTGKTFERLKKEAKRRGMWALGHPKEIGGGGLPFMHFVFLNEVVGRSHWGQICVGTATMQDSIMLNRYASAEQRKRYLEPLVAGDIAPSVGLTEPEVAGSDPTQMRATARARRRRVGHQRAQVVHHRRQHRRVHDRLLQDRARRARQVPPVLVDHRAHRHAGLRDRARGADDGPHRRRSLRDPARPTCASPRPTCSARAATAS